MVLNISDDGVLSLRDPERRTKESVRLPETKLGEKIKAFFDGEKEISVVALATQVRAGVKYAVNAEILKVKSRSANVVI